MKNLIFIAAGLALIAVFIQLTRGKAKKGRKEKESDYGYVAKQPLTENEQVMYWRLTEAFPNFVVIPQVNMSSFIKTNGQAAFNTIASKSVDFLICNKGMEILAAIEIDDKSHSMPNRIKADTTKELALDKAGIKLIRWPSSALPSKADIVKNIASAVLKREQ